MFSCEFYEIAKNTWTPTDDYFFNTWDMFTLKTHKIFGFPFGFGFLYALHWNFLSFLYTEGTIPNFASNIKRI